MDYVMQFTSDIRYIKGKDNVIADSFSRLNVETITTEKSLTIDFNKLADAQLQDEELNLSKPTLHRLNLGTLFCLQAQNC